MPDAFGPALDAALAVPGLGWLALTVFVAGAVRGFSGFGTALVFMPVAALFVPPVWALVTLALMDVFGPLPNLPRAFRTADRPDLARLLVTTLVGLPLGLMVLTAVSADVFRIAVSVLTFAMLAILIGGLRYPGRLGPGLVMGTGGLAGFLGGAAGLPGPPVILLYMASPNPAPVVRASIMAYLFLFDMLLLIFLALRGEMTGAPVALGLMMALPNLAGNLVGALIFRPGLEKAYRATAYTIIAGSALMGLPVWG